MGAIRAEAGTAQRRADVQWLLLEMIAGAIEPDPAKIAGLAADDWGWIDHMARQHRLKPLLHHRFTAAGQSWPVPGDVALSWRDAYRKSAIRWLQLATLLARLDALLTGAAIPFAALKGAFLAQYAWPHPALRPLRDIDLLVPRGRAIEAHNLLMQSGFVVRPNMLPPESLPPLFKHLAPVVHQQSGIHVEIHGGLFDELAVAPIEDLDRFAQAAFARRRQFGGDTGPCYLDPADLLLHVIVHAALDHKYNNGPLTLSDVAFLVRSHPPDWPEFWRRAEEISAVSACQLTFRMAEQFEGPLAINWPPHLPAMPSDALVRSACLMTLADFDERKIISLGTALLARGWRQRAAIIANLATPDRVTLAGFARDRGLDSPRWLVYLHWAANRIGDHARRAVVTTEKQQIRDAATVVAWLER